MDGIAKELRIEFNFFVLLEAAQIRLHNRTCLCRRNEEKRRAVHENLAMASGAEEAGLK